MPSTKPSRFPKVALLALLGVLLIAIAPVSATSPRSTVSALLDQELSSVTYSTLSLGGGHTCARASDNVVRCWGSNSSGQLGDGTNNDRAVPTVITQPPGTVKQISAGGSHTCMVIMDGALYCWGDNTYGQIGDSSTTLRKTPTRVTGISAVETVSAGTFHTCAATREGEVWCWGQNNYGQLGDGSSINRLAPTKVVGLSSLVQEVASGSTNTCALTNESAVFCWGDNAVGQLGDGTTIPRSSPVAALNLSNGVRGIGAGDRFSCALLTAGGVKCWGLNIYGQIGDGTRTVRSTPVTVLDLTDAQTLAVGSNFACALSSSRGSVCWGSDGSYQLGDGSRTGRGSPRPVMVRGLVGSVRQLGAGGGHACALLETGSMRCWGWNDYSQLGNGYVQPQLTPAPIVDLPQTLRSLSVGNEHSCAVTEGGAVLCWGTNNSYGALGTGDFVSRHTPTGVVNLSSGVASVTTGDDFSCALTVTGAVKCWGHNDRGQLGDGSRATKTVPVAVQGLDANVSAIAAGGFHACALLSSGEVRCWGFGGYGNLGNGSTDDASVPATVINLGSGALAIAAGFTHTCAILKDGTVRCWGRGDNGQLGNGSQNTLSSTPVTVTGLNSPQSLALGTYFSCAILDAGGVSCWGNYGIGQSTTPALIPGVPIPARVITAGGFHACAVTDASTMKCWGTNGDGELGDGTTLARTSPVSVVGLSGTIKLASAGYQATCVGLETGGRCWGQNLYGQLGNGTARYAAVPVSVVGTAPDPRLAVVSGFVGSMQGAPIAAVTVSTNNGLTATTLTDGTYTIMGLAPGTYTLTASKEGYSFSEPRTVTLVGADIGGQNFVGTPLPPTQRRPLIFIHGIMGSTLHKVTRDGIAADPGWPGQPLLCSNHRELAMNSAYSFVAVDAIRRVVSSNNPLCTAAGLGAFDEDIYKTFLDGLRAQDYIEYEVGLTPARRTLAGCDRSQTQATFFVYAYDWRQSNALSAAELHDFMRCIRLLHPKADGVDVVTHSMGGLVARRYIIDVSTLDEQARAQIMPVKRLITMVAPWLGAPRAIHIFHTGVYPPFATAELWGNKGLMTTDELRDIARTFPGAHELAPSQLYYERYPTLRFREEGWDFDGDDNDHETHTYAEQVRALNSQFGYRAGSNGEQFHTPAQDDWDAGSDGVEYYHIVGIQRGRNTVQAIRSILIPTCKDYPLCFQIEGEEVLSLQMGQGDGTVPIESAQRRGAGATFYEVRSAEGDGVADHGDIVKNTLVLRCIRSLLGGSPDCAALAPRASAAQLSAVDEDMVSVTLTGVRSLALADSLGHVSDTGGDPTQPPASPIPDPVPGVGIYPTGASSFMLVLPTTQTYTLTLRANDAPLQVDVLRDNGQVVEQAVRYRDLALSAGTEAQITLNTTGFGALRHDSNSDGVFEREIPVTVSVSGSQAADNESPDIRVTKVGSLHQLVVTLDVTDGTGVQRVRYSLDGQTYAPYTGPVTVDATKHPIFYAFAEDTLANRSGVFAETLTRRLYLPAIRR